MNKPQSLSLGLLSALVLAASCSSSGSAGGTAGSDGSASSNLFDCAYNHAYQQTYENDKIDTILVESQDCYVLVDPDEMSGPSTQIAQISENNQVGCYISVGTGEDWRIDYQEMKPGLLETEWDSWPGEYFVTDPDFVLPFMLDRIDHLAKLGCGWVEYDNMDWDFDEEPRLAYAEALCAHTHEAGMLCMAKNSTLASTAFDGLTLESYTFEKDWWEANEAETTMDDGEPLLIVHYDDPACSDTEEEYRQIYGNRFVFLCEDPAIGGYQHSLNG